MRPLELRLRNFRSYAGEHVFDFTDRRLVGIVGPIGSGKSSILDGIVFALYGRTPRIPTATRTLINQRAADASVTLLFEVEGEIWEAARSIRIKGASKHALYRYEGPAADPVEKLTLEGEVNERIQELLGLDFSAFERSVLLAQGRFAEFLQARPADRDRVLKGVFGHDRIDEMKMLAKARRDAAELALEKLSVRLERTEQTTQRLAVNEAELESAQLRSEELEAAAKKIADLDSRLQETSGLAESITARLQTLDEHARRLPEETSTERVLQEAGAAEQARLALAAELDEAQRSLQTTEKRLSAANEAGEPETLARAAEYLAAAEPQLKAVVAADRRITAAEQAVAEAREKAAAAATRLEESEHARDAALGRAAEAAKILEEAEAALERGRHADMAATLRAGLVEDEPCPVCEQLVADLPGAADAAHLEELEVLLADARQAKKDIDEVHSAALANLERTREQVASAGDKIEAAINQLDGARDDSVRARGDLEETTIRLEKLLGPGDPAGYLEERKQKYEALLAARDDAQRRVDQIRGRHDQSIRDEQEAAKLLQELGVKLADLSARLEIELEIGDDAESLQRGLCALRTTWIDVTTKLRDDKAAAEQGLADLTREREELLADVGLAGDVASAAAILVDRMERIETDIAADRVEIEEAAAFLEQQSKLSEEVEVFGRINTDLTDSRFIRYLLDEERMRLADLGSEHFQRLSAGRYRFADDQFSILDLTAADATRRADSLSGGETFLASLGLALALAEMVAGTGGRLDAFFLDEGFGTLDPEHLDLAMEGIESLVADASSRLVVIVSHVPELRDRVEDLIELERSPVTGDTRVVSA